MIVLQRAVHAYLERRRLVRKDAAARLIQRMWRGHQGRQEAARRRYARDMQQHEAAAVRLQVGSLEVYTLLYMTLLLAINFFNYKLFVSNGYVDM